MVAGVQFVGVDVSPQMPFSVTSSNTQCGTSIHGLVDLLQQLPGVVVIGEYRHQKRSSSGRGSWPAWTCMAPNSAQRFKVGMFLPGFNKLLEAQADLIA